MNFRRYSQPPNHEKGHLYEPIVNSKLEGLFPEVFEKIRAQQN
jgi:hypothetical protein